MAAKREDLFPEHNKARYGENRRARPLFLPNLLRDQRFKDTNQDHAYEIICKWADIESSGKLDEMKETAIEGEFSRRFLAKPSATLFSPTIRKTGTFSKNSPSTEASQTLQSASSPLAKSRRFVP